MAAEWCEAVALLGAVGACGVGHLDQASLKRRGQEVLDKERPALDIDAPLEFLAMKLPVQNRKELSDASRHLFTYLFTCLFTCLLGIQ